MAAKKYYTRGGYWYDKSIIYCFDKDGIKHKIIKITTNDDLTLSYKYYENEEEYKVELWYETIDRFLDKINELETESINIIREFYDSHKDYYFYLSSSTGKDSVVLENITKKVIPNIDTYFINTSMDSADTYRIAKKHNYIFQNPKEGFYTWIKNYNMIPTRTSRACCSVFKEGNMDKSLLNNNYNKVVSIIGVRNSESNSRATRQTIERNPKWNNTIQKEWYCLLPIRKWSDLDIWLYILKNNLEINPRYKQGYNRVGCLVVCPYANKTSWALDKYWFPKQYKRWYDLREQIFVNNKGWCAQNCTIKEFHTLWNAAMLYRKEPTEDVINEFIEYNPDITEKTAKQYFEKKCKKCNKNIRNAVVIAMNLKYFGENTKSFLCKKCFKETLQMKENEWKDQIDNFKEQGCKLF